MCSVECCLLGTQSRVNVYVDVGVCAGHGLCVASGHQGKLPLLTRLMTMLTAVMMMMTNHAVGKHRNIHGIYEFHFQF